MDIDGVLNSEAWLVRDRGPRPRIEDDLESRLVAVLLPLFKKRPDLKVVVSSVWREIVPLAELRQLLTPIPVIDVTPTRPDGRRGSEIDAWLLAHEDVEVYAVVDDETFDMEELVARGIVAQTDAKTGITPSDVERLGQFLDAVAALKTAAPKATAPKAVASEAEVSISPLAAEAAPRVGAA